MLQVGAKKKKDKSKSRKSRDSSKDLKEGNSGGQLGKTESVTVLTTVLSPMPMRISQ